MQDNMKWNNNHIIGLPEGEEEQRIENLLEKVIMDNVPDLMREKARVMRGKSRKWRGSQSRGTPKGPFQDTS